MLSNQGFLRNFGVVVGLRGTSIAVYNNSIVKVESKEEREPGGKALEKLWDLENSR